MKGFKFFLALVLLPLVAAQMWALADLLVVWLPAGHWRAAPTLCLASGFVAWMIIFFTLPHPLWIYVLSHELTHALAVYISGGKVYAIQVASSGGHVASDRVNWWISLSPYFIPLYTLIWMGLWYSVDFYYPLNRFLGLLCFGFGFTFSFHVTYTVSMLHKDQKDLISQGFFFSYVVIAAMNLLLITLFFIPVAQNVNWTFAARQLMTRAGQCYSAPVIAAIKAQQRSIVAQTPLPLNAADGVDSGNGTPIVAMGVSSDNGSRGRGSSSSSNAAGKGKSKSAATADKKPAVRKNAVANDTSARRKSGPDVRLRPVAASGGNAKSNSDGERTVRSPGSAPARTETAPPPVRKSTAFPVVLPVGVIGNPAEA